MGPARFHCTIHTILYQEDDEIKAELTTEEFEKLVNPKDEYHKLLRSALEYQGFDLKTILRPMIRNRNNYLATDQEDMLWDLINVSEDLKWTEKSKRENYFCNHG